MPTLAFTPFLDPLDLHAAWYLLLPPLALLIAVAYKAVRAPDLGPGLRTYVRQTLFFALQIILGIAGLWVAGVLFVRFALPALT